MFDPAEPTIICPYDQAHQILKSRMQFHLPKCRAQYHDSEKATCPYNSTHIVNRIELEFHKEHCNDRRVVDSFIFQVGGPTPSLAPVRSFNLPVQEEDWDSPGPTSVLDQVKEGALQKNVLIGKIGAPKAERKAYRNAERLRYQAVSSGLPPEPKFQASSSKFSNTEEKAPHQKLVTHDSTPSAQPEPSFTKEFSHSHNATSDFPVLAGSGEKNKDLETKSISGQITDLNLGHNAIPPLAVTPDGKPNAWAKPNAWGKPLARLQSETIIAPFSNDKTVSGIGGFPVRPPSNPWATSGNQPRDSGKATSHLASPAGPAPPKPTPVGNANAGLSGIWARGAPMNMSNPQRSMTSDEFPCLLPVSARGRKPRS